MATLFVRHTVSDYKVLRKAYDAFGPTQTAKAVKAQAVYQAADDPNDITVTHDFVSVQEAQSFVAREELKAAMQDAGVIGAPTIWITNRV